MPVIRVSSETWSRMQRHAKPFEDKPEDVIRMALDALEGRHEVADRVTRIATPPKSPVAPSRAKHSKKLPQREFRGPLLITLHSLGGGAYRTDIKEALYPRLKERLIDADYAPVSTGEPRWWNAAQWERNEMVKAGLLQRRSPHGYWELTEEGKEAAINLRG